MQKTMKSVLVPKVGDAEVLKIIPDYPCPEPQKGEVIVKVAYASVNPIDWKTRKGLGASGLKIREQLPWGLGCDVAGTIIAVGSKVSKNYIGYAVCGVIDPMVRGGTYAEQVAIHHKLLSIVPKGVSLKAAAAVPLAGLTALQALADAKCKAGKSVLVIGGASGVGHLTCQLAVQQQADVTATTRSSKGRWLESYEGVKVIDLSHETLPDEAFDIIIDLVGGEVGIKAVKALKADGVMITVPTITADEVIDVAEAAHKKAYGMMYQTNESQLEQLLSAMEEKTLSVRIDSEWALEDIALAHLRSESGTTQGKIIIKL